MSVYIREFEARDAEALLELNTRNRTILQGITPFILEDSFFTREAHMERIEEWQNAREMGNRYEFGIFLNQTNKLIGSIALYKFNPSMKCLLGYFLDKDHYGKGYATEAVKLILNFAFKEIGFHRVEAGVMPRNIGSIRVLEKVGFTREGLARDYISINGVWEDHYMFSILESDTYGEGR